MKNILFVCTGNTCRSSMAEALFKDMLQETDKDLGNIKVHSAGIFAVANQGASPQAVRVMKSRGIDISQHKATLLTRDRVEEADLILTMTAKHKHVILDIVPEAKSKTYTLKEYAELANDDDDALVDISDPFGQADGKYENTAQEIKEALNKVLEKIQGK